MMDENLIGYALNALDADDHRRTEEYVRDHPEAKRKLELIRAALKPLEADREPINPPAGLVDRTMARVSEVFVRRRPVQPASREAASFSPNRWRRMDVLVACSILILLGGLGTSGLVRIKQNQYRMSCQNNLQQLSGAIQSYASLNNGALPKITDEPPYNKAGEFITILKDSKQIAPEARYDCPGAPDKSAEVTYSYHFPHRDEQNRLHGLVRDPSNGDSDLMPIVADVVNWRPHGQGFNVLFNGGNVRYTTSPNIGVDGDNILVNDLLKIAAGLRPADSVLAPPDYPP
jgi:hypothetical protein